ncbi:MAG: hypothetical protein CMM94_02800 [Rickettsiales bacterium]|nr:hypothetical protein [Rickettsiales bacterium]
MPTPILNEQQIHIFAQLEPLTQAKIIALTDQSHIEYERFGNRKGDLSSAKSSVEKLCKQGLDPNGLQDLATDLHGEGFSIETSPDGKRFANKLADLRDEFIAISGHGQGQSAAASVSVTSSEPLPEPDRKKIKEDVDNIQKSQRRAIPLPKATLNEKVGSILKAIDSLSPDERVGLYLYCLTGEEMFLSENTKDLFGTNMPDEFKQLLRASMKFDAKDILVAEENAQSVIDKLGIIKARDALTLSDGGMAL